MKTLKTKARRGDRPPPKTMREKRQSASQPLQKRVRREKVEEKQDEEDSVYHDAQEDFCDATVDAEEVMSDVEELLAKDSFAHFNDGVSATIDISAAQLSSLQKTSVYLADIDATVVAQVGKRCEDVETALGSIKQRLVVPWMNRTNSASSVAPEVNQITSESLDPLQQTLLPLLTSYTDVQLTHQTHDTTQSLRDVYCLHALNHILKTRDRILKNTLKIKTELDANLPSTKPVEEHRDQGFTRPRVLILAPFKNDCHKIVSTLQRLSSATQIDNLARFTKEYTLDPTEDFVDPKKSVQYQQTFAGNIDDCFRVGLRFSRRNMKIYSDFYSSDVLVCSPLGLRMIVGAAGIEVVILDHADTFAMQNWDHVQNMNDTDYSRVKGWYLDGKAAHLRQTVILSSIATPLINSLFASLKNVQGKVRIKRSTEKGTLCIFSIILGSITKVHVALPQLFQRINTLLPHLSSTARFDYFKANLLPKLTSGQMNSCILFIPSYFDFVRVRNYLTSTGVKFSALSEYSTGVDISRERLRFFKGECTLLLLTERLHFFKRFHFIILITDKRYAIRGARHVVWYQIPEYPECYEEVVNRIDVEGGDGDGCSVSVMWDCFDAFAIERVVGCERFKRLIEMKKDVFVFSQ